MLRVKRGNLLSKEPDYEFLGTETLDGGTVRVYQNHELGQVVKWWKDGGGRWYVKVDDTTYSRVHNTSQGWALDQSDRYEKRPDGWYRKND